MQPENAPGFNPEVSTPVIKTPEASPEPSIEVAPAPAPQETFRDSRESANQNSGMPQQQVQQVAPAQQPAPVTPQQSPVQQRAQTSPAHAKDGDVIEREWVDQAKQVIGETRNDPYAQEARLNQLRSQYLQKRYGKEIKPRKKA